MYAFLRPEPYYDLVYQKPTFRQRFRSLARSVLWLWPGVLYGAAFGGALGYLVSLHR